MNILVYLFLRNGILEGDLLSWSVSLFKSIWDMSPNCPPKGCTNLNSNQLCMKVTIFLHPTSNRICSIFYIFVKPNTYSNPNHISVLFHFPFNFNVWKCVWHLPSGTLSSENCPFISFAHFLFGTVIFHINWRVLFTCLE